MSNPRREALLLKIEDWHEQNEHEKILLEIDKIPREFWDYEITCLYARSLNNAGQYDEAFNLLLDIKTLGRNDALWNSRIAYSLYYLGREEEAAEFIQKAIELGDNTKDAKELFNACIAEAKAKKKSDAKLNPLVYSEDDLAVLEHHIEKYFGSYDNVFHEIVSPDIHVDIAAIEPTAERNYYVLITIGMGARKMHIPAELKDYKLERAEIMVCLPPDWKLDDLEDEKWYWPLRWLKILARLPGDENTWLGWGHTIPNGKPFAENTCLSALMLIYPGAFGEKSFECKLTNGDEINFYQMIPLYNEEIEYKLQHNAEALLDLMNDNDLEYVKLKRRVVTKD